MKRNLTETISTTPLEVRKTARRDDIRGVTSGFAGKIIPLKCIPLLREDRIATSNISVNIQMTETLRTLMNPVAVTVKAVFVPFLAFDRFEGSLDRMNRAYAGEPDKEGGDVVPFFATHTYDRTDDFYKTLGIHAVDQSAINSAYIEAYNTWINFRRAQITQKLPERLLGDTTLAGAEWNNSAFKGIVSDFDQAAIDGEVSLNIISTDLPVYSSAANGEVMRINPQGGASSTGGRRMDSGDDTLVAGSATTSGANVFAELQSQGIELSLSNIELAKKTAAFAALRKKYDGLPEDFIIDLLMEGIRVPDADLSKPIVLDRKSTIIGYDERFATSGGSLDESRTTGDTRVNLRLRTPPMNTGGVVLITCEIVPEQLFERQQDHFLTTTDAQTLPSFSRDYLDPEKVNIVPNSHVDVLHGSPSGTFGYAPLNYMWRRMIPNIGGKYFRTDGQAFDEERQRIWAVETTDPELTSDFFIVNEMHHKVFADENADPFEITTMGSLEIVGNTVFGKGLEEDTNDYDTLLEDVDTDRIDQDA